MSLGTPCITIMVHIVNLRLADPCRCIYIIYGKNPDDDMNFLSKGMNNLFNLEEVK